MAVKNHVSLVETATGTVKSTEINAKSISWISNDGAADITFNFEETVTTSGAFKVPAGGIVDNIDTPVGTIYYISTGADVAFSLFGIAR